MKKMAFFLAAAVLPVACFLAIREALPQSNVLISTKIPELVPVNREFDIQVELRNVGRKNLQIVGVNQCWGNNCVFQLESTVPVTVDAGSILNVVFSVKAEEPGDYSFRSTIFTNNNGHLAQDEVLISGKAAEL